MPRGIAVACLLACISGSQAIEVVVSPEGKLTIGGNQAQPLLDVPGNDQKANAFWVLPDSGPFTGSTVMATDDCPSSWYQEQGCYNDQWDLSGTGPDVWYVFESDGGCYTIQLCHSDYDTSLALFDEHDNQLGQDEDEPGCPPYPNSTSRITECTLSAGPVYIAVDGYNGGSGNYVLNIFDCDPQTVSASEKTYTFGLQPAHPNPFNPRTTLSFQIAKTSQTRLAVYALDGRHVKDLYNGLIESGEHQFDFDGSSLASGFYFCVLEAAGQVDSQRLLLLK